MATSSPIATSHGNSNDQRIQFDSSCEKKIVVASILRELARTPMDNSMEAIDKVNFANVNEIKGNTFNKKDFFNLLRDGKERLRSFTVGNWPIPEVDPVEMAEAGFYYLQNQDRVQCVYCEIVLDGWEPGDDPLLEHARHSRRCNFIAGYDVKNIPIRMDPIRGPNRRLPDSDVCGTGYISSSVPTSEDDNMSGSSDEDDEEEHQFLISGLSGRPSTALSQVSIPSTVSTRKGPVHKSYVSLGSRLKSFDTPAWPASCPVSKYDLASAGFFYYGDFMGNADSVKCFYCDTGLCQWEPTDDPWKEHKRVSPDCEFVTLNDPSDIKKNMDTQEVAENWLNSALVQEFLKTNKCSKNVVKNVLSQRWLKYGFPFSTMEELREAVAMNDPLSNLLKEKNEQSFNNHEAMEIVSAIKSNDSYGWSQFSSGSQLSSSQGSQKSTTSSGYSSQCNGSDNEESSRGRLTCKVCWDRDVGCIIKPCNHVACCTQCGPAMTTCPICRNTISSIEKVYF